MDPDKLAQNPRVLLRLLGLQRDLYSRLVELSAAQHDMIAGGRADFLLGILQERQSVVQRLARLNEQLSPYRRNWDATLADLPTSERAAVNGLINDINRMLGEILAADREDSAMLAARKQAAGQQLGALAESGAATAAYHASAAHSALPAAADLSA